MAVADLVELEAVADAMDALWAEADNRTLDVIALRKRGYAPALARALAEQLDLRTRAVKKLPTMAAAGCLFERTALEQATPEPIALGRKALLGFAETEEIGNVLDLTTGLGADFLVGFAGWKGTGVEGEGMRVRLLAHNRKRLSQDTLKIFHHGLAEEYLSNGGQKSIENGEFAVLAVDPDRRPNGIKRAAHLAASSPDVTAWVPWLERAPCVTLIKASPMDDITALKRLFPKASLCVQTIDGEVKEVAVLMNVHSQTLTLSVHAHESNPSSKALASYSVPLNHQYTLLSTQTQPIEGAYLWEAGAGLRKAGLAASFCAEVLGKAVFSERVPLAVFDAVHPNESQQLGRWWRVLHALPYKPKALQALLQAESITHVGITRYILHPSEAALRASLKLRDGGQHQLIFGEVLGTVWVWVCERV